MRRKAVQAHLACVNAGTCGEARLMPAAACAQLQPSVRVCAPADPMTTTDPAAPIQNYLIIAEPGGCIWIESALNSFARPCFTCSRFDTIFLSSTVSRTRTQSTHTCPHQPSRRRRTPGLCHGQVRLRSGDGHLRGHCRALTHALHQHHQDAAERPA